MDLEGITTNADFEVIQLEEEAEPYPALLGIEWAFDNNAIINLKNRTMTFKSDNLRLTTPLHPIEGNRYTEPVKQEDDEEKIGELYNITVR